MIRARRQRCCDERRFAQSANAETTVGSGSITALTSDAIAAPAANARSADWIIADGSSGPPPTGAGTSVIIATPPQHTAAATRGGRAARVFSLHGQGRGAQQ